MESSATSRLVSAVRRKSGLSQEALAQKLGVSFATVNAWERGRSQPRSSHLNSIEELARSLGIRTDLMVLAIDDDPAACMIIEGLVAGSSVPATVETTTDPSKGLILCGALEPNLLLIDVMMPTIDGFEVARQLAEINAERMPTVVFVTASTDLDVELRAADLGHEVLHKPLRQVTMDALLTNIAAGSRPIQVS